MTQFYSILKRIKRVLHLGMLYSCLESLGLGLVFMISPKRAMKLSVCESQTKTTMQPTQDTSSQDKKQNNEENKHLASINLCDEGASVSVKQTLTKEEIYFIVQGCKAILKSLELKRGKYEKIH